MAPCPGGRACLDRAGQGGGPLRLPQPWLGWVGRWCSAQVHLSATWTDHHQSAAARSGPGHSTRAAHDGGALWSAAWQAGGGVSLLACVAAGTEQLHHRGALRACCRSRGATRNGTATVAKQRSTRRALWPGRLPGQPSGGRAMIIHGRAGGRSLGVRADVHGWL